MTYLVKYMTSCTQYCILEKDIFKSVGGYLRVAVDFLKVSVEFSESVGKLGRHLHLQLSVCGHWERLWNV